MSKAIYHDFEETHETIRKSFKKYEFCEECIWKSKCTILEEVKQNDAILQKYRDSLPRGVL